MNEEILRDIRRLKKIIRAKKCITSLDKFHVDLLKRAERLLADGDDLCAAELCIAANTIDNAALTSCERLVEIRQRYSKKCGDGVLDVLLEKHFGKYVLSKPLNGASSPLILLRAALLDKTAEFYDERILGVRIASLELPEEYSELKRIIYAAACRTEQLIRLGETEHAYALVDAVHALPEIAGSPKPDLRSFVKCFIRPFIRQYGDGFFEEFDLRKMIK